MADTQEAVRRLSIQATTTGVTDATKQLNDLAKAQGGVAVASSTTEKATLSLDQKFASIERRYVAQVRAQQDFEKIQKQVNAAVAQNPALQERANTILAAAKERHDQLANSQKAMGVITADLNSRIQAQAGSFGVVGNALTALGPGGLAAAAGIGALAAAFYLASAGAHELAAKARELKDFSESTGLTVNQVQALRSEATKFGVDSDTLQAGLQKFTTGFQDLRLGTGDLLTQIRRINPALADQMAVATDTATAFTLFGQAVAQTTNIFERNALARAGLGKGGPTVAEFLGKVGDVKALTDAYDAAGKGLQKNMIDKLAELDLQINKTTGKAKENLASIFAQPVLETELAFARTFLQISEIAKNFTISDGLARVLRGATGVIPILGPLVTLASATSSATAPADPMIAARGGLAVGLNAGLRSSPDAQSISDLVPRTAPSSSTGAGGETPESLAAKWKNYVSVLGTAATPTERLNASIAELGVKAKEAGVGADVLARGVAGLKLDDAIARQSAHNAAVGGAATVTDVYNEKLLQLTKQRQQDSTLTQAQIDKQLQITTAQASGLSGINSQIDAEKVRAATLGMSTEAGLAYSIAQTEINKQLAAGRPLQDINVEGIKAGAAELAKLTVKTDLYADSLAVLKDGFNEVGKSMFSAFLSGKNVMDAMIQSLDKIAAKLADKAFTNILEGALSGNLVQAGVGVAQAGASALISWFTGDQKAKEEAKKKLEAAQAEWKTAGPAFEAFLKQMSGGTTGAMTAAFNSMYQTVQDFVQKAAAAHDYAAVERAYSTFNADVLRTTNAFRQSFGGMLNAINAGLGPDSPFAQAASNVKAVGETLRGFIDDAATAYANDAIARAAGNAPQAGREGGGESQIAAATAAAQKYLLSLLGQPPVLSATATAIQTMQGTAVQLKATLSELGMSAEEAGRAIDAGVIAAMQNLAANFSAGLTARLNTALGQSFLNDTTSLLAQHQQDLNDAAMLPNSQALVAQANQVFQAEAQQIVDSAGLIGDAFGNFLIQFPQLADVVHESTTALADAAAAQQQITDQQVQAAQDAANAIKQSLLATQQYIDQIGKTIRDYLNGLRTGASSTLSPQDQLNAAQAQFNAQFALAQAGDRNALGTITQYSQTLLDSARAFFASSSGYTSIFNDVSAKLQSIPDNLTVSQVTAADQIVAAIQESKATTVSTINAQTASTLQAAYGTTGAVNANTGAVNATTSAVNTTGASNDNLTTAQNALISTANSLASSQVSLASSQVSLANSQVGILSSIQSLQSTASAQLSLLNTQYAASPLTLPVAPGQNVTVNNLMIQALNKIVFNTAATAINTAGGSHIGGVFADGGWITGGTAGQDSVRLASGGLGMPGEFVVRHDIAQANKSWLPTFNETGRVPAMPSRGSSGTSAGNDNGQYFAGLARTIIASDEATRAELRALREAVFGGAKMQVDATKQRPAQRPGVKSAAG